MAEKKQPKKSAVPSNTTPFFTQFLNNFSTAVVIYDKKWNFIYINDPAGVILGGSPHELIGKNLFELYPNARETEAGQFFQKAAKTGKKLHFKTFFPPLNKWFEVEVYPSKDGVATCFRDITLSKKSEEVYRTTEERLLLALQGGNSGVWEWDLDTGKVWWSPEMYTLWGVNPQTKINSKNAFAFVLKEDREIIQKSLNKRKKNVYFQREFRINHPMLGIRWMEARSKIISDKKTKTHRIMGIMFDITERKNTELALQESEKKFRATFSQSTIAMSLADDKGNWLAFNKAYPKVFGYSQEELKKMHPTQLLHPDDFAKSYEAYEKLVNGKIRSLVQERRYIHKNGSVIYGMVYGTLIKGEEGESDYVVTVIEDITKRKFAEQAIKESEERFRTLIEQSTDVIQLMDKEGKVLYTSDSVTRVLGYSPQEIMGKGGKPYLHQDDTPRFYKEFSKLLEKPGNQITLEYRLKHKNGSWVWVEATGVNHLDDSSVKAIVGNFRDITQRKLLEKQKDEFLGIVSHELKTPVTSLKAFAQILQRRFRKAGDLKSAEMLTKMDSQINKLTSLIQDLLDVTKVESGRLKMNKSHFHFDNHVADVIEEIQLTTDDHTLKIIGKTGKLVYADKERIGQVLTNFLTNAIKYSPGDTKINVILSSNKKEITVCVQDFGVGIPQDHLAKVFDRFFRVSGKAYDTVPGMGLGLSIAAEIIKRHNGKIWVESTERKGSRFYFTLPLGNTS